MLSCKRSMYLVTPLIVCLLACISAMAQSGSATLGGTILDQNGAVVPWVTITVLNKTTGLERRITTSEDGSFSFPLLPPGEYVMTAQRDGFTTIKVPDLVVNINDQRSVRLLLKVGSISGTIEIVPSASLLQESSVPGTVIDRQFVANLPLNGRGIQSLVDQAPGVVSAGVSTNPEFGLFSVNGQRPGSNYFTIDGVSAGISFFGLVQGGNGTSIPSISVLGGTNSLVSADAVHEIRIQTSSYAAEYGRTPGAQVQITTRAGNNGFSGSLFEYLGNDALDATDFFSNQSSFFPVSNPHFRQNDFGGVIGGPVVRNRTFFFVSYEGMRLLQPSFGTAFVPSVSARQSAPAGIKAILDAMPLPNGPNTIVPGLSTFTAGFSNPSILNNTSIRIDHTVNSNLTIFGKYTNSPSHIDQREITFSSLHRSEQRAQTVTTGAIWLLNANITNESLVNYSRYSFSGSYIQDNFAGAVPFPNSLVFPSSAPQGNSLLAIIVANPSSLLDEPSIDFELLSGTDESGLQRQINFIDNLSISHQSHQMKFGVDYRYLYPHFVPTDYEQSIEFLGGVTGGGGVPTPGSLLSGIASEGEIISNDPRTSYITNLSLYAQDTWKASPRLTFTYGLRWEFNPAPRLSPARGFPTLQIVNGVPQVVISPGVQSLFKTSYNNFAPRFGISLQLSRTADRELVLRAGAGTFYDLGYTGENLTPTFPPERFRPFQNAAFPLDPAISAPVTTPTDPASFLDQSLVEFDRNFKLPRTYEWNVTLEQSIGPNQTISASYVGAAGRSLVHLQSSVFSGLSQTDQQLFNNNSSSDYNSFQLRFQRRLSRGVQIVASYTLAHSIDTDSVIDGFGIPDSPRGPSDFDVRHSFTSALTYSLPNSDSGLLAKSVFKDWSVDLIGHARSALPVDVAEEFFPAQITGDPVELVLRPDLNPGVPLYLNDSSVPGGKRINPAAFTPLTQATRQGTLGRNALRGFPAWQIDFGLHRQLNITERLKLQIRAEAFNIFNHPNFANPSGQLGSPIFGISETSLASSLVSGSSIGGLAALNQIGGPRSIQFALRLQF